MKNMKKSILLVMVLMMFLLASCSGAEEANEEDVVQVTPTSLMSDVFDVDFEDAASSRTQLAYGTLQLQDSEYPVSTEQANTLLPLWQALLALENNPDSAEQELTAVQDQIIMSMQDGQLQAIAAMRITNAALTDFYADQGIIIPTPSPDSTQTVSSGTGKNSGLSVEEKEATKAAAEALGTPVGVNSGSSGAARKSVLTESVIEFLTDLTN
jgi:hypothetical protein